MGDEFVIGLLRDYPCFITTVDVILIQLERKSAKESIERDSLASRSLKPSNERNNFGSSFGMMRVFAV